MKKITFILIALLPIFAIGQTFEFNGSAEGWTGVQGTLTENATSVNLAFDADTAPKLRHDAAGVDASSNKIVSITLKNNSSATQLRFVFEDLVGGGNKGTNLDISANDADFITYYIDLNGVPEWDNDGAAGSVQNALDFAFRQPGGVGNNNVDEAGNVDIDQIAFITEIPREEKLVFDFNTDGDSEGWMAIDGEIEVSGGNLTMSGIENGDLFEKKMENLTTTVNADDNKILVVTYQNNSALNDQLRFTWDGGGQNQDIMTSTSEFQTVVFDLRLVEEPNWTGITQDFQFVVRNTANASNEASVGTFVIDKIEFSNDVTLSTADFSIDGFTIYPNPAKNKLNIKGFNNLSKIEMFDITGKQVLQSKALLNDQLDVSGLNSGLYLIKLYNKSDSVTTRKLIIAN